VELIFLVVAIGLLAALAIPNLVHARGLNQQNSCINNLRSIDNAKQSWAIDNRMTPDANPVLADISIYLSYGKNASLPICPLDMGSNFVNSYTVNNLTTAPGCKLNSTNHILL
jgi:type II secretory pathway pseudopilin PulG